jgi:4-cresol dehydrogenase (hydroxylating) flavoprotein subunit
LEVLAVTISDPEPARFFAVLRSKGIDFSVEGTADWSNATYPWPGRPIAIVHPNNADEAAFAATLAGLTGAAIHPVSLGRNWGLGSRLPVRDGVIIDLSRLNNILAIDDVGGTARIEPGVTFEQLQKALVARGLGFHLPSFGGPTSASVLANAMERGEGSGPSGDRHAGLFDLDVALSTGERIRTGFGRFGKKAVTAVHGRPAGPLIEGLFSQSGLGLVLSGRITLNPTLYWSAAILFEFENSATFVNALPILQNLLRNSVLHPHDVAIWNDAKRMTSLDIWANPDIRTAMHQRRGWGISIIIASDFRHFFEMRIDLLKSSFEALAINTLITEDREEDGTRVESHLTGFSHGLNVASAYAMKPKLGIEPLNPDQDRCGFIWLCPVVPFDAQSIRALETMMMEETLGQPVFGAIGFQAVSARALHGYISLAWDRADPAADESAMAIHDRLARNFEEAGLGWFRVGHAGIRYVARCHGYDAVVDRLAKALDPHGVMSSGKIPGR